MSREYLTIRQKKNEDYSIRVFNIIMVSKNEKYLNRVVQDLYVSTTYVGTSMLGKLLRLPYVLHRVTIDSIVDERFPDAKIDTHEIIYGDFHYRLKHQFGLTEQESHLVIKNYFHIIRGEHL
jgi:hypothetical protein